jgi:hypothetical protein
MNINKLKDLYQVDRRTLYAIARAAMWGAHKKDGAWNFDSLPLSDPTMSTEAVAKGIHRSCEIVRRWCRESERAKTAGEPVKLRATKVGRSWRIHFEDGARLIVAQLGGFRKQGNTSVNNL